MTLDVGSVRASGAIVGLHVDLQAQINKLESLFDKGSLTDQEKTQVFSDINALYSSLKPYPHLMRTALYVYGRAIYGANYKLSAILLKMSLQIQIEKSCPYEKYNTISEMENEPFLFDVPELLAKVQNPTMSMIHTAKWYGFACQNGCQVGYPQFIDDFEKLYALITSFCKQLNTKDSIWEIGQIIYNTRPLLIWKKGNDYEGQLAWIRRALHYIELEGDTPRCHVFQTQMYNMENVLLGRMPPSEDTFLKKMELAKRAYETSNNMPNFDPFLKLNYLNNYAKTLFMALKANKAGVTKEEILSLYSRLLAEIKAARNLHAYFPGFLRNIAEFEAYLGNEKESNELNAAAAVMEKHLK